MLYRWKAVNILLLLKKPYILKLLLECNSFLQLPKGKWTRKQPMELEAAQIPFDLARVVLQLLVLSSDQKETLRLCQTEYLLS